MTSGRTWWTVSVLAGVGVLFLASGLSGPVRDAVAFDAGALHAQAGHIHAGRGATSDLVPLVSIAAAPFIGQAAKSQASETEPQLEQSTFQADMRRLWEDHITWTRLYIVSAAADLPDRDLVAQRLLRNQTDIGNAVKTFYGEDAGNELASLLTEHILGAVTLLEAAKGGDQIAIEAAREDWYANADAIGAFLSAANPEYWPLSEMQTGMRMHLDVTLAEATARLNGDFEADIAAYDEVHEHILAFADLLSDGIIAQFPYRFAQ